MVRTRLLTSLTAVSVLSLLGVLAIPVGAHAAPGDDVLVFSNSNVVDTSPGSEYERLSDAITAAGYIVTSFDGGDGQPGTWATALANTEIFVLPEQEGGAFYDPGSPPVWLSSAAMDVLVDWIESGGTALISGSCNNPVGTAHLLSQATSVTYGTDLFNTSCTEFGTSVKWIDDSELPDELVWANGTYEMHLGLFSEEQLAPLTVWYSSTIGVCSGEALTVGEFAAGDGRIAFDAWDYYDDHEIDQTPWNTVLAALLDGSSATSSWTQGAPTTPPLTTEVTASGQSLYTISESYCDGDEALLYRIDPGTALSAPVSGELIDGNAYQGATDPSTGISYIPFWDAETYDYVLLRVDLETGTFTSIDEFFAGGNLIDTVYSIAIDSDGKAYALVEYEPPSSDYTVGLFALDLSTADLSLIAEIDQDQLDEPNAFAYNPADSRFYAFEEDTFELFEVNVGTGALTPLGVLDAPSIDEEESDVTAMQIATDGTFYVVWDEVYVDEVDDWGGMLARFTLGDITGGVIAATEIGVLTDDVMESDSLLLSQGTGLASTGADAQSTALLAGMLLTLGLALVAARRVRRTS